ncbi:hypothetical protein ACOMHN_032984 [Nucella lapillus]
MELGILHNSQPSTKRGCRAGRLHRLWHGLPPAPWPCTRSQHHSVPSRNLHPLMVPPFLQPHPDLQSAVGNAPLSSKHPAQLPTTDCLLSIISPMGGQPSDAPALSPPSPLQQGGQSSNAPALSPPSPLPQGGQPIALALSPPSPPPQGGQPSDAPGLSPSSSTLLLCPSDSTLNICHLNSQSAVKTGNFQAGETDSVLKKLDSREHQTFIIIIIIIILITIIIIIIIIITIILIITIIIIILVIIIITIIIIILVIIITIIITIIIIIIIIIVLLLLVLLLLYPCNFQAGEAGSVLKKMDSREHQSFQRLVHDRLQPYVPEFRGVVEKSGERYIQLQDLLCEFNSPCVMDIKMGIRTYLEEELIKARKKPTLRKDMYQKMVDVDTNAPTSEEHQQRAVTKPRYMQWRDQMSSSVNLGFRIEGIKKSDGASSKDFKKVKSRDSVADVLKAFIGDDEDIMAKYLQRLRDICATQESSEFFQSHEVVGSSLLFVHDSQGQVNVWMIDFGKSEPLPKGVTINHRATWNEGNHEDGYLFGLDNIISMLEELQASSVA